MFRYNMKLWMGVLLLVFLAAAFAFAAQVGGQRLKVLEGNLENLQGKVNTIETLQLEIMTLQGQFDRLSETQANATIPQTGSKEPAVNAANIALAQNVVDTAGFHLMVDRLSKTKTIEPAYITTVTQVKKVLVATQWPASLTDQNKAFISLLDGFAAALQANNSNDAVDWVNKVHTGQHSFSTAIDNYLSNVPQSPGQPVRPVEIALAQNVMDTAGFHVMGDTISKAQKIDPAYITTVNRVKKVLSATQWPAPLAEQNKSFISQLDALAAALKAENKDQAVNLANNVHTAQHGFSTAIDNWLSSTPAQ